MSKFIPSTQKMAVLEQLVQEVIKFGRHWINQVAVKSNKSRRGNGSLSPNYSITHYGLYETTFISTSTVRDDL